MYIYLIFTGNGHKNAAQMGRY